MDKLRTEVSGLRLETHISIDGDSVYISKETETYKFDEEVNRYSQYFDIHRLNTSELKDLIFLFQRHLEKLNYVKKHKRLEAI